MVQHFSLSDTARLFSSPSSMSRGARPAVSLRHSTSPEQASEVHLTTVTIDQRSLDTLSPSLASIHERWTEGLIQYRKFHLHAALSTFKRLLRELRSPTEESSNRATDVSNDTEAVPYRILLPGEIALLYIDIALIHGYLGSYYLSAAAFEEALLVDDTSGIAWFGLGIARFYLRELGASKRAFGKCQACFMARDPSGRRYQKEELDYRIWRESPSLGSASSTINEADYVDDDFRPRHELEIALGRGFPDNVWKLERARVEWNWRIALFERNYVRKGVQRPGGGKWGLNGIPAGIIFGPTLTDGSGISTESEPSHITPDDKANRLATTVSPDFFSGLKGRRGSFVKEKWSTLQRKVLKARPQKLITPIELRRSKSSESVPSSRSPVEQLSSTSEHAIHEIISALRGPHQFPGILKKSKPRAPSISSNQTGSLHEDVAGEPEDQSQLVVREEYQQEPLPCLFPPRRSSLTLLSTTSRSRRRRSLRGSVLPESTMVGEIGTIEEEPGNDQKTAFRFGPARRPPSRSSDISPKSFTPKNWTDDIMLPNLMLDLAPSPVAAPADVLARVPDHIDFSIRKNMPPSSSHRRSISEPVASQELMDGLQWGYGSFMTDNISPLSSQFRSVMFPSFSDRRSSVGRRPSHTAGTNSHASGSQYAEHQGFRRPSAIVTLTPATPERADEPPRTTSTILNEFNDPEYLSSDSLSPYSPGFEASLDSEDVSVEPLSITKRRRMSVTGRTCLTEWEWEEKYERWQREESASENEGDDDEYAIGEVLLPRRLEG